MRLLAGSMGDDDADEGALVLPATPLPCWVLPLPAMRVTALARDVGRDVAPPPLFTWFIRPAVAGVRHVTQRGTCG